MTSSNAQARNMKRILLNNLESKRSLVMKFGQLMQSYKIIFFIKKFHEKCGLETSSRPFLVFKESSVKKASVEVSMLIWTNFDRFAITNLI